jgi:hypothetical protein
MSPSELVFVYTQEKTHPKENAARMDFGALVTAYNGKSAGWLSQPWMMPKKPRMLVRRLLLRPAWRFTAHLEDGRIFEIQVQAVKGLGQR